MRINVIPKLRLLLLALSFAFLCLGDAQAQSVRFAQITDPHLFDLGDEGTQNRIALAACIKALNARMDENADYKFAVITGDIGVENLVSHVTDPTTKQRIREDAATEERQLNEGAAQLASILAPTKIHVWLFVPGNNDLYLEHPNLNDYKRFLEKLKSKVPALEIKDLCADDGNQNTYEVGGLTLIGFNNASFKNNNDLCRLWANKTIQRGYVEQVIKHLQPNDPPALIFYHIPEIDDPHIVLNADTETHKKRMAPCGDPSVFADREDLNVWTKNEGGPYPDSSWFVYPDVLQAWKKNVVNNKKVLGLFAGHLHDWRRETYSGSLSKLYVCPPLAVKLQDKTPSQARGFQEVAIDAEGRISRAILWLNAADSTFDTTPLSKNNELELALFYETNHDWKQAESHFTEAAKTAPSAVVRNAALSGLTRTRDAQHPWLKSILAWTDPLFLAPYVLRPLGAVAIVLLIWLTVIAFVQNRNRMEIHPFDGDDELAKALAVGFPVIGSRVRKVLASDVSISQNIQLPLVALRRTELLPAGAFEIGGVKVPDLNVLLKWILRPRFQVNGVFIRSGHTTIVYAEIYRRSYWFDLRPVDFVNREIPSGHGRGIEVENLIYEIYLKSR